MLLSSRKSLITIICTLVNQDHNSKIFGTQLHGHEVTSLSVHLPKSELAGMGIKFHYVSHTAVHSRFFSPLFFFLFDFMRESSGAAKLRQANWHHDAIGSSVFHRAAKPHAQANTSQGLAVT